ncbi:acyl-CoA dehydrogenase family protein [Streptomyces lincolnensis]|uniref:acyl-CoA dehydrogenase family protein n=1 Tax=Streptomyces lincolnensis TaxID=1915 RepID=UPI001E4878E4|nr:acyl-CoA dehydrogenase family protein [Streptomyces lincolnensis]MCD7444882.1 acyl-CoA dehydrogenase family protein [Streptomyces lincolnensis]
MAEDPKDTPDHLPLRERVAAVVEAARAHAEDVDARGRFPAEAVAELKRNRLLAPEPVPGQGLWTAPQTVAVAHALGQACASTGMIWAMHQGQIQAVARQPKTSQAVQDFLDTAWQTQPLVASLMSEAGAASPRESRAHCREDPGGDGTVTIDKNVSVSSYLQQADAGLLVARRSAEDAVTEQAVVLVLREELTIAGWRDWQALGMRGTGSGGGRVRARTHRDRILEESFSEVSGRVIMPLSNLGWAACWLGIAESAFTVAQDAFRRQQGRTAPDVLTAKTMRLGRASDTIDELTEQVRSLAERYEEARGAASDALVRRSNALRLTAAARANDSVLDSFQVIGVDAYREPSASRWSLSRQIRDVLSARVMISEDRIRLGSGQLAQLPRRSSLQEAIG